MADKYEFFGTKHCSVCGKEMPYRKRLYCSPECREQYWLEHPRKCSVCGKEFVSEIPTNFCHNCRLDKIREKVNYSAINYRASCLSHHCTDV